MIIDRRYIGHSFGRQKIEIEEERVRAFAASIGETDPVYSDRDAARAAGLPGLAVPLTFYSSLCKAGMPSAMAWAERIGVQLDDILHGQVRFRYIKPIYAGVTVSVEAKVSDIRSSKRGNLDLVMRETEMSDAEGEVFMRESDTLIVRSRAQNEAA